VLVGRRRLRFARHRGMRLKISQMGIRPRARTGSDREGTPVVGSGVTLCVLRTTFYNLSIVSALPHGGRASVLLARCMVLSSLALRLGWLTVVARRGGVAAVVDRLIHTRWLVMLCCRCHRLIRCGRGVWARTEPAATFCNNVRVNRCSGFVSACQG
jgi:hypothetical protein